MAIVCIDAELTDNLEGILAPVLDVDEGIVERCAVVSDERFSVPEGLGGSVNVRRDDLVEESRELAVGERDTIQAFEFLPEVCFKLGSISDVGAMFVF
jgi:hypothetical protein